MSPLWVFVDSLAEAGAFTLSQDESRHVVSRRLREGDSLTLFDAQGRLATARIERLARKSVEVEVDAIERVPRSSSGFRLATAIPKGERLSTLLQMWTQLGLESWQPLICDDSAVRKLDTESARIRRILVEGCKVARRPWALNVERSQSIDEALEDRDSAAALYYADRMGEAGVLSDVPTLVFIGPEAGLSTRELRLLEEQGAKSISLGDFNLRIETAGVAAMAAFNLAR
jgi:16S rRNA (uracil1498-N3)-methyltransferase